MALGVHTLTGLPSTYNLYGLPAEGDDLGKNLALKMGGSCRNMLLIPFQGPNFLLERRRRQCRDGLDRALLLALQGPQQAGAPLVRDVEEPRLLPGEQRGQSSTRRRTRTLYRAEIDSDVKTSVHVMF